MTIKNILCFIVITFYSLNASAALSCMRSLFGGSSPSVFFVDIGSDKLWVQAVIESEETEQGLWVTLSDVKVSLNNPQKIDMYLQSQFGWGHSPLNVICKELTEGRAPYASGYGTVQANPSNFFGFKNIEMIVLGLTDEGESTVEVTKDPYQAHYYPKFYCKPTEDY